MFKIYSDNYLIYDNSLESLEVFNPKISSELNSVGSFTFTIYPNHPYFDKLQKLKSIVTVYQDGSLLFRGRIISDENGFYNEKKVTCESDLSFLLDSIQRPYEFQGTPAQLFTQLIQNHNEQVDEDHQFVVGNITVTDPNNYISRSDSKYMNTWESIEEKMIEPLGGYVWIRHEDDGNYIDYLDDFNWLSNQKIEFGKNLLDLSKTIKAEDVFTVIVPVGAEYEVEIPNPDLPDEPEIIKKKLTIEEVNDGKDYLEHDEGVQIYGRIVRMVEWEDVTDAQNLKTKAIAYLADNVRLINTITLSAVDLGSIDADLSCFHLGTKVKVASKPHNIDDTFLVKKLSIDLIDPSKNKIQLGTTYKSMTETQRTQIQSVSNQVVNTTEKTKIDVIAQLEKEMSVNIETSSDAIIQTVSETYYTKEEIPQIVSEQTSELKQTVDGFEMNFNTFQTTYGQDKDGTDKKFEEINKYIRFVDGKIYLGEKGNSLELRISNERLSFYQDNNEVAYFSDNMLHFDNGAIDIQYKESTGGARLQLGKFAFIPRSNGNLSFKKVRD